MRNHTSTFLEWLPDKTMLHRGFEACKLDLGFRIGSSSESWKHGTRSTTTEAYIQTIRSSFFDFALGESGGETFGVSQG